MNINNIYQKWEDKINRSYIDEIYQNFQFIGNKLFEDRNLEDVLNTFLHYENLVRMKHQQIKSLNEEIGVIQRKKGDLMNYSSDKLRYEKKLTNWLKNLSMVDISKLNSLINIKSEFNEVDRLKFEEMKRNRGSEVTVNLNT